VNGDLSLPSLTAPTLQLPAFPFPLLASSLFSYRVPEPLENNRSVPYLIDVYVSTPSHAITETDAGISERGHGFKPAIMHVRFMNKKH
jgi:hypothetical protein